MIDCRNQQIKISKGVSDALALYSSNGSPRAKLLSDYADARLMTKDTPALNPWADKNRRKGVSVESGMTADETEFLLGAYNIRKFKPSDIILQMFYNHRNDSGVECGFMLPLAAESLVNAQVLIINPSPFVLRDLAKYTTSNVTIVVKDVTLQRLYASEFRNYSFINYSDYTDKSWDTILVFSRDEHAKEELYKYFSELSAAGVIYAYIGNAEIEREGLLRNQIIASGLFIEDIHILPSSLTQSVPKKKSVVKISRRKAQFLQCYIYDFNPQNWILSELAHREIAVECLSYKTLAQINNAIVNNKLIVMPDSERQRKAPEIYHFSDEIKLFYTIIHRVNYYSANVRFASLDKGKNKYGRTLAEIKEKGLNGKSIEDVIANIENIPYLDDFAQEIVREVCNYYKNTNEITLKTAWFCQRQYLSSMPSYDDIIARELFSVNEIAQIKLRDVNAIKWVETLHSVTAVKSINKYVLQMHLLFASLKRKDLVPSNPLEKYTELYSARQSKRQTATRKAHSKVMLEDDEERKILEYLTESIEINSGEKHPRFVLYPEDFAALLKVFLPLTPGEICALNYADLKQADEVNVYQLSVDGYVNSQGELISYIADNTNRKRFVPIPYEVRIAWARRKDYLKQIYSGSSNTIDKLPVFMTCAQQTSLLHSKGSAKKSAPVKLSKHLKKLFEVAEIDVLNLWLPGSKDLVVDVNHILGDFFNHNFEYKAKYKCKMSSAEIMFLRGKNSPEMDTFSRHYCDYDDNALIQYSLAGKMRRWSSDYANLLCADNAAALNRDAVEYIFRNNSSEKLNIHLKVENEHGQIIECWSSHHEKE